MRFWRKDGRDDDRGWRGRPVKEDKPSKFSLFKLWGEKGAFEVGAGADLPYLSLLQTPTLSLDDFRERERKMDAERGRQTRGRKWEVFSVRETKENREEGEKPCERMRRQLRRKMAMKQNSGWHEWGDEGREGEWEKQWRGWQREGGGRERKNESNMRLESIKRKPVRLKWV